MEKRFLKGFTLAEESCYFACSAVKIGRDWNLLNKLKDKNTLANKRKIPSAIVPYCISAFTLAEVLITLAIIGVVASLTIPTLVTNYKKKTYVTQLKKTYNYLTNGFHQIMAQDGVSNLSDTQLFSKIGSLTGSRLFLAQYGQNYKIVEDSVSGDEIVSDFMNELKKTFNITAFYDFNTMPDEYNVPIKGLNGGSGILSMSAPSASENWGIYLNDGTFISMYMINKNPDTAYCERTYQEYETPSGVILQIPTGGTPCTSLKEFQQTYHTSSKLWQTIGGGGNVTIDVNGPKGPNTAGRDIFYFVLGNDGNLYPLGGIDYIMYSGGCDISNLNSCTSYWNSSMSSPYGCDNNTSMGMGCAARIMEEGWEMKY